MKNSRQVLAALAKRCKSYSADDCFEEEDNAISGFSMFAKHDREIRKKVEEWIDLHSKAKKNKQHATPYRFGEETICYQTNLLKKLATKMSSQHLKSSFVDEMVNCETFQGWFRLSVDSEDLMRWFDDLVTVDEAKFNALCQSMLRKIFGFMETTIHGIDSCFEKAIQDYLVSDKFTDFYMNKLPKALQGNRAGAI